MHAAVSRLLLRKQTGSGQSTLASLFRNPFVFGSPQVVPPLLLEADCPVFAARFSSAGASHSSLGASGSARELLQSLETRGASFSLRQHHQQSLGAGASGPSAGRSAHSHAANTHVPARAADASSDDIDQPEALRLREPRRSQEDGGGIRPGIEWQVPNATRAATRSFVLPNADNIASSAPWGNGLGSSPPQHVMDQPLEFDFPAKAYYIGALLQVYLSQSAGIGGRRAWM